MKILIVDDSAFMRTMIKNVLKEGNHELFEAGNFDEAVKAFKDFKPSLVFLDVIMPGRNGVEALREIKGIDKEAHVVMCTSVGGQQKIIDEAVSAGADDFIIKPFKPEDILKVVTNLSSPKK